MAGSVSDEAFARYVNQIGIVTLDKIEAARAVQEESARKGTRLSLADVLVQQGVIPQDIRENIEKKIAADQQTGGIKQLGPYKLLKKLGEGGMGAVYLADDTSVGRKVAVKVLPKKYSDEREFLTRFRREAQATGKLNHVNIVMAYNVDEEAGTHYYAMEYCDGDTLDRILKRDKVIPWDAAVGVVLQVARGLKHAHDHGIIHRDIKPANIFICKPLGTPEGAQVETFAEGFVAKILDLGLSKNISGDEQSFYTQTGVALGTPHYISPEQAKGEKGIDGRTDIYSLGATFYHLVTGQTPFSGTTAGVIMAKHLTDELTNPQDINPDIPDGVAQVIAKMMTKEPADRYANCKELLDDLELVIDGKMPSSQAIDVGKSSVAVARVAQLRKLRHERGTRQQQPVGGRRGIEQPEFVPLEPVPNRMPLYIGAGVAGLGLLVFVLALVFGGKPDTDKPEARSSKSEGSETASGQSSVVSGGKTPAVGVQPETGNPKPETGVTDAWIKMVQAQPAEKQVEEVVKKLKELNPGFDGKVSKTIDKGNVAALSFSTSAVKDLSPVRALQNLKALTCCCGPATGWGVLADLTPLSGMQLTYLECGRNPVSDLSPLRGSALTGLDCSGTRVSDLSPLKDSKLVWLNCGWSEVSDLVPLRNVPLQTLILNSTKVRDLSPLKDTPLKDLLCDFVPERDGAILRSITTLKTINDTPAAEFWKKVDAELAAKAAAGAERPWKPIFDGKTLDCLVNQGDGAWRMDGGALVNVSERFVSSVTQAEFEDGEVRIRFMPNASYIEFKIRWRDDIDGKFSVQFQDSDLKALNGGQHTLAFNCRGNVVTAMLNGAPRRVVPTGGPRKGKLQICVPKGSNLRIFSIEYRELAPERLEVGQKDKDGWTCIFNGRDLTGWEVKGKPTVEDAAVVVQEDSEVTCRTRGPDFELRGSVRPVRGPGYCGVLAFRLGGDPVPRISFCTDGDVHFREAGDMPMAKSGPGQVPVGEWRSFVLRVVGNALTLQVGGKPALKGTVAYLQGAGFKLSSWGGGGKAIAFKDLWLRELGPDGKPLGAAQPDAGALPKVLSLDLGGGGKMDFVLVPAGEFDMGSNDGPAEEKPIHRVKISKPFYVAKYEVTQAQYEKVVGRNPSKFKGADLPVEQVSWEDAQVFCKAASKLTGRTARLPTEAEWEYACRAGTTTQFSAGQGEAALGTVGWYDKNSGDATHPVGQKKANAWGLYDMHGNVPEWCEDWHVEQYYAASPAADPQGPEKRGFRVLRGGSWYNDAARCRSACRIGGAPGSHVNSGFRVVVKAPKEP